MTREESIEQLQNCKELILQDGKDWLDERDIPLIDMAISALSAEPKWNCTASFIAEQLEKLKEMTDEERVDFLKRFFGITEPSDLISRDELLSKLKRRKKFFIDAWGSFHLLSITDKSRVDELDACIAEVTNAPTIAEKYQLSKETSTNTSTELISRTEAIEVMVDVIEAIEKNEESEVVDRFAYPTIKDYAEEAFSLTPSASAERVVRCKDCKWYDDKGEIKQCTIIPWRAYYTTEDGFCDRAKMKGGAE